MGQDRVILSEFQKFRSKIKRKKVKRFPWQRGLERQIFSFKGAIRNTVSFILQIMYHMKHMIQSGSVLLLTGFKFIAVIV